MRTRKILALIICAVMILSMIPVTVITASAANDSKNMWTTNRQADEVGADIYRAASGYSYTARGFSATGADFTKTYPFLNVETKEKVNVKDGLYMEIEIDAFSYKGLDNTQDEWVSFNVWSEPTLYPGQTGYGQGYLNLLRSAGAGAPANVENYLTTEEAFGELTGGPAVIPTLTLQGQEKWSFEVRYDETTGYTFVVNGTVVLANNEAYNEKLEELSSDGLFYVGVSLYSTENSGEAALTVTKYGNTAQDAEVPEGDETKEAEENLWNREWECADSSTVPENAPALLWDATQFAEHPKGTNLVFEPTGDDSYKVEASNKVNYFGWTMGLDQCYDGYDFPVFAMFVKDLNCNMGNIYPCAGDVVAPGASGTAVVFSQFDKSTLYYNSKDADDADSTYALIFVDLDTKWTGRIHQIRIGFDQLDMSMPEFEIMYMGIFRSEDEAINYTSERYADSLIADESSREEDDDDDTDTVTDTETETETETEAVSETATKPAETETEKSGGCSGVVGVSAAAVVLVAAAAAVVLKKKED